jgi:hypothetical protein
LPARLGASAFAVKIMSFVQAEGQRLADEGSDSASTSAVLAHGMVLALAGLYLASGGDGDERLVSTLRACLQELRRNVPRPGPAN